MSGPFNGAVGVFAAKVMARVNRDTEAEAVARLDPAPADRVLTLGFGPGVGVALLAARLSDGKVVGVDPSETMVGLATRRNRQAVRAGRVVLHVARADAIPTETASFDGAIAVNTLQLCEPIAATAAELARVLRPGARFVSLTHDWAVEKHAGGVEAWIAAAQAAFAPSFEAIESGRGRAEKGRIVVFEARRALAS
jgi:ubiquinone/menaquinone biosynthesis C-methylase UbiE